MENNSWNKTVISWADREDASGRREEVKRVGDRDDPGQGQWQQGLSETSCVWR